MAASWPATPRTASHAASKNQITLAVRLTSSGCGGYSARALVLSGSRRWLLVEAASPLRLVNGRCLLSQPTHEHRRNTTRCVSAPSAHEQKSHAWPQAGQLNAPHALTGHSRPSCSLGLGLSRGAAAASDARCSDATLAARHSAMLSFVSSDERGARWDDDESTAHRAVVRRELLLGSASSFTWRVAAAAEKLARVRTSATPRYVEPSQHMLSRVLAAQDWVVGVVSVFRGLGLVYAHCHTCKKRSPQSFGRSHALSQPQLLCLTLPL